MQGRGVHERILRLLIRRHQSRGYRGDHLISMLLSLLFSCYGVAIMGLVRIEEIEKIIMAI